MVVIQRCQDIDEVPMRADMAEKSDAKRKCPEDFSTKQTIGKSTPAWRTAMENSSRQWLFLLGKKCNKAGTFESCCRPMREPAIAAAQRVSACCEAGSSQEFSIHNRGQDDT